MTAPSEKQFQQMMSWLSGHGPSPFEPAPHTRKTPDKISAPQTPYPRLPDIRKRYAPQHLREQTLRPAQQKLATVLSNFDQSIVTCAPMSQAEIIIIVRSLGKIADEILILVADEYMTDHYKVLNGHQGKYDRCPTLFDVAGRCAVANSMTRELEALRNSRRPGIKRVVL